MSATLSVEKEILTTATEFNKEELKKPEETELYLFCYNEKNQLA